MAIDRAHGLAMPIIMINMGGEMLYVLEQRLRSQKVEEEKATRVLSEVVRTMFSRNFVAELFRPQPMYSLAQTREVFDRLAHSSIIKLNKNSMDKLFDLMAMSFKRQVLACSHPAQLVHMTMNHIESLKATISSVEDAVSMLENAGQLCLETYGNLGQGDLQVVRQQLLRLLQDKHVKISLFLQKHVQNNSDTFRMQPHTRNWSRAAARPIF